jgi:hypothetical protein
MNWKILSQVVDQCEITPTDTQNVYEVYIIDDYRSVVEAITAYGNEDRTKATRYLLEKYGDKVVKIEHFEK